MKWAFVFLPLTLSFMPQVLQTRGLALPPEHRNCFYRCAFFQGKEQAFFMTPRLQVHGMKNC